MSGKPKNKGKSKPDQASVSSPVPQSSLQGLLSVLALAFIVITSVSRIILAGNPMSRDEGAYGYLGKLAAKGLTPYLDFYEMKPPMLYYLYGLGGSLFGFTDLGLRLFGLVLTLCSSFLIFLILSRYISKHFALVGAALFSILSLNPFSFGFAMVAEHLVNTLVLVSLYLVHKSYDRKGLLYLLLAGTAFATAILTKQTAILFSPVFLLCFILARQQKPWFTQSIQFAAGVLIPVAALAILFIINGAFSEAMYWLTTYPAKYASSVSPEEGKIYLRYFSKNISFFQLTLFITAALALIANLIWIKKKPFTWFMTYFIIALLTVIPGFRFYGQYWMLIFAPMALMTAAALNQAEKLKPRLGILAAGIVMVLMAGELIIHSEYYFGKSMSAEVEKLYKNNPFGPIRKLSTYAGSLMKEDDTFMVFGSEPQAYLYADKIAPSKHVFMSMISKHDEKSKTFISEAMNDLEQKQPTYVLYNFFMYSWGLTEKSNDKLYSASFSQVINHYTPVAAYNMNSKSFLYAKDGDQIDASIANQVILFKRK
ncbi:MAG TPA: glycosyltransferase family 39 protein [Saprospiraceae bacterium]|nr:glycosyltransferase family 39 protein [Saprospiraceae bacterium]